MREIIYKQQVKTEDIGSGLILLYTFRILATVQLEISAEKKKKTVAQSHHWTQDFIKFWATFIGHKLLFDDDDNDDDSNFLLM